MSHLVSTLTALIVGLVVLTVYWVDVLCDTFDPDTQASIERAGPGEITLGVASLGMFLAVAALGFVGSFVGLRSRTGEGSTNFLPSVASLLVPHGLLMVILVLLSRESVNEALRELSDSSMLNVFDDCANAFRLTPLTVPLLLLPMLLMFVTAYRLGSGKAVRVSGQN